MLPLFGRNRRTPSRGRGMGADVPAVLDNFVGADGSLIYQRVADSGHVWNSYEDHGATPTTEKFKIATNQARAAVAGAQNENTFVNSGRANCRVRARFPVVDNARIVARCTDGNNKIVLEFYVPGSQYYVYRFEAGVVNMLLVEPTAPANNDEFELILNGSNISVTRNDVDEGLNTTSPFNASSDKHGLSFADTVGRAEWFKVNGL